MAEFSAEAPLAKCEADEDWIDYSEFQAANCDNGNNGLMNPTFQNKVLDNVKKAENMADNFGETFTGSLEDLVNTFDDKITKCFRDLDQNVESLAPVQIRNQDDIINESQMWWTLTGNYGNILPIDWSKSMSRRLHLPTLQLSDRQVPSEVETLSEEDEAVANDLDLHALIVSQNHSELEGQPLQSAEDVIKEIDDLMQDPPSPGISEMHQSPDTPECAMPCYRLHSSLDPEKLVGWSVSQLNEFLSELEWNVQHHSETLIAELALRDELEFEKELKNTFISLLLNVQNKRRQMAANHKKAPTTTTTPASSSSSSTTTSLKNANKCAAPSTDAKYITTVIPYHQGNGPPTNATVQVLIKILRAIVEDSPTVPTLLTDYILRVLCPT